MKIKTALITTAGFGTRFLPITKTIQKEMLPILNRPLVDYVVADCIQAGIEKIIFVVSEHNKQLIHFYRENKRLYSYLDKMNKIEKYQSVEHLHNQAEIIFIKQPDSEIYGTATPVKIAEKELANEDAFLVFMGDDFIFTNNQHSEAKAMIELFNQSNSTALATCITKPNDELHKYGIAQITKKDHLTFLKNFIEKPAPGTAPSNLVNISKYIFTPQVFEFLKDQKPNPSSGELYITDTITDLAKSSNVVIHTPKGEYLDGGSVEGWLKANLVVASKDPELKDEILSFVQERFC